MPHQDLPVTVRVRIGFLIVDYETELRRRGRRSRRHAHQFTLSNQILQQAFTVVFFAVLVGERETGRAVGLAGVEMPAKMTLGFASAGIVRPDGVPADPLTLLGLAVPGDKQKQERLAFVDHLAGRKLDLPGTLLPANIQGDRCPRLRVADCLEIIVK